MEVSLISLLVTLLILGIIIGLIIWVIDHLIPVPAPFNMIIKAIIGVICLIYLIGMLTGAAPAIRFR